MTMQRKRSSQARTAALAFCLLAAVGHGGAAQTAEQFYRGKTITSWSRAYRRRNDLTARLISRHLTKHIPGNPQHRRAEPASRPGSH